MVRAASCYLLCCFVVFFKQISSQYEPTWDSLDRRPLPSWYDKAKVGIFLHWGVYSVPSFHSEWFWYHWLGLKNESIIEFMEKNYPPNTTYQDFGRDFTTEFFQPDEWADLFVQSGAKYVVLTSKHHEGYTLWPSKYSYSWNSMDVGPHKDLVGLFAEAIRKTDLHLGLYHSLFEWYNPLYVQDKANWFLTSTFIDTKVIPEMKELINTYQPEILWSDGDGEASDIYWKSREFLAWLYNESPVKDSVVTNDRWGVGVGCRHGGFFTCADRYNPGHLLPHKWENCMTLDKQSWGYRRNAVLSDIMTIQELLETLVQTVSCGGNILINLGPTKEGTIIPIFQERLLQLGQWLSINGDAIYESSNWTTQNDTLTPGVWYTAKEGVVYAIALSWPQQNRLDLGAAVELFKGGNAQATLLGSDELLSLKVADEYVSLTFPDKATVRSQWAWVVKIVPPTV